MFYVYVYLDPRNPGNYIFKDFTFEYKPFYIGKGKSRLDKRTDRKNDHWKILSRLTDNSGKLLLEKAKKEDGNIYKLRLINKIISLGFNMKDYIKVIKEFSDEKEALKFEEYMISLIGRKCDKTGPLTNLTKGGEYHRFSTTWNKGLTKDNDERIRKLSKDRIGSKNPMYGKKQSYKYYQSRKNIKGRPQIQNNLYKYIINNIIECTDFKAFCLKESLNYYSIMSLFIYFKSSEINYHNYNFKRVKIYA